MPRLVLPAVLAVLLAAPFPVEARPRASTATTPIATLAKDPATRPVLDLFMPGVTSHPKYFDFQWLTPRELQRFDSRLTPEVLTLMDAALLASKAPPSVENTPIFLLAARPETRAVLEKDLPGRLQHPNYPRFRFISLRALQGFDPRITDDMLSATQAALDAAAPVTARTD